MIINRDLRAAVCLTVGSIHRLLCQDVRIKLMRQCSEKYLKKSQNAQIFQMDILGFEQYSALSGQYVDLGTYTAFQIFVEGINKCLTYQDFDLKKATDWCLRDKSM